ncbi:TetR/AcrR family transcriptional regulator [Mangrovicoccus ximenensis]|uniref:TetR/AcrR family transcriptional regulator n=1 Tax=Mangrovicoccus ximenensis TaxID=1911570 RepID=UPI000D3A8A1A|nr:TetR/AcrR family transcriptional regulator [Mangrovicoccus ximenensis]
MSERPALTSRGLARRQVLLREASELFLAKGFGAVTVDGIIAVAGGSKTNVYRQFGGKEGLFIAVVEQLSAEFLSPLDMLDLGPTAPEPGLAILARTLLRQLLQPRHIAFQRMVLASSGQFPELMAHWYEVGPRRSQQIIARHIAGAQDAAELARLFHDMVVTDPVTRMMMGRPLGEAEIEAHVRAAAATIAARLA